MHGVSVLTTLCKGYVMSKNTRKPSDINDDFDHVSEGKPSANAPVYMLVVVVALVLGGITFL